MIEVNNNNVPVYFLSKVTLTKLLEQLLMQIFGKKFLFLYYSLIYQINNFLTFLYNRMTSDLL